MNKTVVMIIFMVACVALGALSGAGNAPGEWYQSLNKPFFHPPGWIFAPVWTVLYVLIGAALSATWFDENNMRRLQIFAVQAVLNLLWSPAFFGLHSPVLGLVIIVPLLISIMLFIAVSWPLNRWAAWLFVPYAAWVAFATLLNLSIVLMN
ncbi:TspO/MBR family protein [Rhizobium terrae]|uniref:TspO/MBR family protein n=1 Tax=Rhizobium terrae TaxID=2171756 RepID=UPI000E3BCD08|nr:TspO/MBR family protein [Rhizobium terrae]